MIVTPWLSVDIVRYLSRRTQSRPLRWVALSEIADHVYGPEDVAFSQAVDLARMRGWIIVEGKAPSKRACLTKAGCLLVPPAAMGRDGSPMMTFALASERRDSRRATAVSHHAPTPIVNLECLSVRAPCRRSPVCESVSRQREMSRSSH
jgi:hypothetical protein